MFCSGCGQLLRQGNRFVPNVVARRRAPPPPRCRTSRLRWPTTANRVRALSTVWFIYGGLSLALGIVGLALPTRS